MILQRHRQTGLSLVEVMVALFVGVFLLAGSLAIYANGRGTIDVTARISRMQDNARYALELLEPDLRAAGFWGSTTAVESVEGRAGPGDPVDIAVAGACENNWAVNLDRPIEGFDNANPYPATCIGTRYVAGTDVLIVRHASDQPVATADLQPGTLYVRADELRAELFVGTTQPTGFSPTAANFRLLTHAYYVAPQSDFDAALPSLRRLVVDSNGATPAVVDEEVLSGAEDLQVQFGLDTDGDGSVNSYVDPDAAIDLSQVLSARLWVRLRTQRAEDGFRDNASYVYADVDYTPADSADPADDRLRRLLVSKTVALRNRVVDLNGGI